MADQDRSEADLPEPTPTPSAEEIADFAERLLGGLSFGDQQEQLPYLEGALEILKKRLGRLDVTGPYLGAGGDGRPQQLPAGVRALGLQTIDGTWIYPEGDDQEGWVLNGTGVLYPPNPYPIIHIDPYKPIRRYATHEAAMARVNELVEKYGFSIVESN